MSSKLEIRSVLLSYMPLLIEEVHKREMLWNPKHQFYTNRKQAKKSWMEVSKRVKLPVDTCKSKWKNLKDVFRKEIKRYGMTDPYHGSWQFFDQMSFLSTLPGLQHAAAQSQANNQNTETHFVKLEHIETNPSEPSDEDQLTDQDQQDLYKTEITIEEDPLPPKFVNYIDESMGNNDSDMMFLKSLAPYMRQLDPRRKLIVRNKIQAIILCELGFDPNNV